jgi:hypothetical protein
MIKAEFDWYKQANRDLQVMEYKMIIERAMHGVVDFYIVKITSN